MKLSMRKTFKALTAIVLFVAGSAYAASFGGPGGKWPASWPEELEPFREDAWTWEHGLVGQTSYDIPFGSREEFEAVWPHILKLKSEGTPLTLLNEEHYLGRAGEMPVGVIIFPPLKGHSEGEQSKTRIYLKVDGHIIDMNRIPLPANTPIVDKRFTETQTR